MVSLVKLSSQNIDTFKELSSNNSNFETYDKDFFEYYKKSGFIPKVFMKKFVKLFLYQGKFIGYIWHEVPVDFQIKVLSLYVDTTYTNIINKNTLRSFDKNLLIYESLDTLERKNLLQNLGFSKINSSLLMHLDLTTYNMENEIGQVYNKISNDFDKNKLLTIRNHQYLQGVYITFDQIKGKSDILTRWELQNNIFNSTNRIPITLEDIENDINQDYYIYDLAYFIKVNGSAIGYGQVIYTRNMYTLVNFGISEEYRGFGFGKLLLNFLIKKSISLKITDLHLRVDQNNNNAIALYNWIGFKEISNVNKWERK